MESIIHSYASFGWCNSFKGKEIMVEEPDSSKTTNKNEEGNISPLLLLSPTPTEHQEEMPHWLHELLRIKFWRKCEAHDNDENRYRVDESIFCIQCFRMICPYCRHDEPSHWLLKIRCYMFCSVVRVKDMQKLGIDVSQIQRREDISPDDFSGPEASHRIGHSKTQADASQVEDQNRLANRMLHRRARK